MTSILYLNPSPASSHRSPCPPHHISLRHLSHLSSLITSSLQTCSTPASSPRDGRSTPSRRPESLQRSLACRLRSCSACAASLTTTPRPNAIRSESYRVRAWRTDEAHGIEARWQAACAFAGRPVHAPPHRTRHRTPRQSPRPGTDQDPSDSRDEILRLNLKSVHRVNMFIND